MHREIPPHEKIRFRRSEIVRLHELPSAAPPANERAARGVARKVARFAIAIAVVFVVLAGIAAGLVGAGFGETRLRNEARSAVERLVGEGYRAEIGSVRISLWDLGRPSLEVNDVVLAASETEVDALRVGQLRFGLRIGPLMRGEFRLGNVSVDGASVRADAMPRSEGGSIRLFRDDGLVDPDAVLELVFETTRRFVLAVNGTEIAGVHLGDIAVSAGSGERERTVTVQEAVLSGGSGAGVTLSGTLAAGEQAAKLEAEAMLDPAGERVSALTATLTWPDAAAGTQTASVGPLGSGTMTITGREAEGASRLAFTSVVSDAAIPLGREETFVTDVDLSAYLQEGLDKIEFERLRVAHGRSSWRFHGAVGPTPATELPDAPPSYRFELVSDGSTIAPEGSPEPDLTVTARVAGHLAPNLREIAIDEIGVRSRNGEIRGGAEVVLAAGETPGLVLDLEVEEMPLAEVKQVWPWFAARGARNWVMGNIFGGEVTEGGLTLDVPAGRLGNGVPLNADEIKGRFAIERTRFDVAGRIPPVRDGNGAVAFRGSDVDISLESGTVYMPSGRTVDAANGELTIRDAHEQPVIGKLDIEVDGSADAILQLASYDPIDVDRFIDLAPADLKGEVSGNVQADIPLQKNIPTETLGWRVALDYSDLDIAKPFEGQTVTGASGTIVVDPDKAVIEANARLNGAPATLDLIEPLSRGGISRQRRIVVELDDEAREAIAPGLDVLLSGPAKVELDDASSDERAIEASLDAATLTIPWVGWSKGAGVDADVSFTLKTADDRTELADFSLSGETFGASGALSLIDGEVARVRFPSARLNRDDDFSFDMQAKGGGYAITVRGRRLDARSVVKLYSQDAKGGTGEGGVAPVTVDLEVDEISGFHGAVLRDVSLNYSGTGARTDLLEFSAVTPRGDKVTFSDRRDGDQRTVEMRSSDAGTILRFLDIYEHMEGGQIALALTGRGDGPLVGQVDARDFRVVNEPRLSSLVSSAPNDGSRSLNQAVRGEIDTSRVQFERGYSRIEKGTGYLRLQDGILRGPTLGASYQGTLYDGDGNMNMTGTLMPAYGLNRIFGEIPIIGQILGNGRDRGLIGITFRVAGKTGDPRLEVNPLSVIAPGIFRSVFEFR